MDLDNGGKRVFQRLGGPGDSRNQKVCFHWRAGNCNRHPCPFLHRELQPPPSNGAPSKRAHGFTDDASGFSGPRSRPNYGGSDSKWGRAHGGTNSRAVRKPEKVFKICRYWLQENCEYGEGCRYLHSWSLGDGFSMLTQLEGHQKVKIFGCLGDSLG